VNSNHKFFAVRIADVASVNASSGFIRRAQGFPPPESKKNACIQLLKQYQTEVGMTLPTVRLTVHTFQQLGEVANRVG
jgi:hypothetical protein